MADEAVYSLTNVSLTQNELKQFQELIYKWAGIHMSDAKSALIAGRLLKRLRFYSFTTYQQYLNLLQESGQDEERRLMVNILTTNETYFFREDSHLQYLQEKIIPEITGKGLFRLWSAAASTGEEAYSIAMILSETLGSSGWEIIGTDINGSVIEKARNAVYPMERSLKIPDKFLKKYCLKGVRSMEGSFMMSDELKSNVKFGILNLNENFPDIGNFDVVFLRNVMIYFDTPTKQKVIDRIYNVIKPQGYLIIGHSENLNSITHKFKNIVPTVFRKL